MGAGYELSCQTCRHNVMVSDGCGFIAELSTWHRPECGYLVVDSAPVRHGAEEPGEQRARAAQPVGGRIRHDPRFPSTLVWNNFPFPTTTAPQRQKIIDAGRAVLAARANHDKSLAQLYDPLAMPTDLIEAHRALDRVIDRLFGFNKTPGLLKR